MEFLSEQFNFGEATVIARLVREYAKPGMIAVELGTRSGRTTLTLLPTIRKMDGHIYCVGWSRIMPDEDSAQPQHVAIPDRFLQNIRESGFEDYVTALVGTSKSAAMFAANAFADMIFVNADHGYSGMRQAIVSWYPRLKQGGIMCGYNFAKHLRDCDPQVVYERCEMNYNGNDEYAYGVIRAVSELFPDVHHDSQIWWVEKGDNAPSKLNVFYDSQTIAKSHIPGIQLSEEIDRDYLEQLFADELECMDAAKDMDASGDAPILVAEDFNGYNIFAYKFNFYAYPLALGNIDIAIEANRRRADVLQHRNVEKLKEMLLSPHRNACPQQIRFTIDDASEQRSNVLFLGIVPPDVGETCLNHIPNINVTCLIPQSQDSLWQVGRKIHYQPINAAMPTPLDVANINATQEAALTAQKFDSVVIPYAGGFPLRIGSALEEFAARFAPEIIHVFPSGRVRRYRDEDINRITYSRAYYDSMLQRIGSIEGLDILDVGCSDGLGCDLLTVERPNQIVGIDADKHVGSNYPHADISYARMNAQQLAFDDNRFDVGCSIAVFEHIRQPGAALQEMIRVIKPGGFGYVQAGPLYYSPFGHHMFGYFDDIPWIHLRMTPDEIVAYARERGIDQQIQTNMGRSVEDYIYSMLNEKHINGMRFEEYGLIQLAENDALEIVHYVKSYDGKKWLTPEIQQELAQVKPDDLVIDRFEITFRVL